MTTYLLRHLQVFFYTLGQLARAPLASLMTIAVIGIALSLPSGLYVLIENIQRVSADWDKGAKISLFLKRGTSEKAARSLRDRIKRIPAVADVDYISPRQALAEFKRLSGFGEALDALGYNPLPPVLVVRPGKTLQGPAKLDGLVRQLRRHGEVDLAQIDLQWVKRLHALLRLARRGVWIVAVVLALAVLLIIGNTIRLAVLNRRDEIQVIKLVGGTSAFIRRPFLYAGLMQGTAGALVAWLLVNAVLTLVAAPVDELARLYASSFAAHGLGYKGTGVLFAAGAVLGWVGSRVAVGHHLREIEPL
ncbi:MAG: permease-like cell division protein FtsX [Acidiferrobacterales bacterium]